MTATHTAIIKRIAKRAILAAIVFVFPAYVIKWGQLHPHIDWSHYVQAAVTAGLANSALGHREFYTAHFHWQELACLLIYLLVSAQAEYLLAAYGASEEKSAPLPRSKRDWLIYTSDEERTVRVLTISFVFLFVASCSLCERTQMGMISVSPSVESMIRDAGIVVTTYFLFKSIAIVSAGVTFNGMVVRTDIFRVYILIVSSLAGLSLAFCSWFPLLAIPGARIATTWLFARLRENMRSEAEIQSLALQSD